MSPDETLGTSALARVLQRDEAVVRAIAAGLSLQSRVRRRVERQFTLRDILSVIIVDAVAATLPRRIAFALVNDAAPQFERLVTDEEFRPWSIVWPDDDAPCGFEFRLFDTPEAAFDCMSKSPQCWAFGWRDLVRGAMIRVLEAKRTIKEAALAEAALAKADGRMQ